MIDTIVFDFGGVLIDWNPEHVYKTVFDNEEEMKWFLTNVCTNDWNLEQDRGRSFSEGVATLQKSFPGYAEHIQLYHTRWQEMVKGEIAETVTILKKLKPLYKMYGLTNWSAETFPYALKSFDFLQLFDGIVVSGVEKMIKPDKQFFQLLLDRYALKAEQCVFIDDNVKNINAANEMGFHAIHFTTAQDLYERLINLKLLTE